MDFRVSDEAQRIARDCAKGFSCLRKEGKDLCPVELAIGGKVHFVRCLNDGHCSYQYSFGNGFICGCPVRKEIFNKYRR